MAVNVIDIINGLDLKQLEREANRLDYVWESEEGKELEIRGLDEIEYRFKDEDEPNMSLGSEKEKDEIEYRFKDEDEPNIGLEREEDIEKDIHRLDEIKYNFLEEFERFFSEDSVLMPELNGSDMGKDFVKKLDCLLRIYKGSDTKIYNALSILNDEIKAIQALEDWIKNAIQKTLDGKGERFISRLFRPQENSGDLLAAIIPPNLLATINDFQGNLKSILENEPEEFAVKVEHLVATLYQQKKYLIGQIDRLFLQMDKSVMAMFNELSKRNSRMRPIEEIFNDGYLNMFFDEIRGPVATDYQVAAQGKGLDDAQKYEALMYALSFIPNAVLENKNEDDCKKEIMNRLVLYLETLKKLLKDPRNKDEKKAVKMEEIESLISSLKKDLEPLGESSLSTASASIHSAPGDNHDSRRERFLSSNDRRLVGSTRSDPISFNPSSFFSRASGSFRNSVRDVLLSSPLSSSSSATPNSFIASVSSPLSSSQSPVNSASPSSSSRSPGQDASSSSSSSSSSVPLKP